MSQFVYSIEQKKKRHRENWFITQTIKTCYKQNQNCYFFLPNLFFVTFVKGERRGGSSFLYLFVSLLGERDEDWRKLCCWESITIFVPTAVAAAQVRRIRKKSGSRGTWLDEFIGGNDFLNCFVALFFLSFCTEISLSLSQRSHLCKLLYIFFSCSTWERDRLSRQFPTTWKNEIKNVLTQIALQRDKKREKKTSTQLRSWHSSLRHELSLYVDSCCVITRTVETRSKRTTKERERVLTACGNV